MDVEAKKLTAQFAENENRAEIPAELARTGWGTEYSTSGGRVGPSRLHVNELLSQLSALCLAIRSYGPIIEWDSRVEYGDCAMVRYNNVIYVCNNPSADAVIGTAPDIDTDHWRTY